MAKLYRTKSGRWASRKAIPKDVRAAYGQGEATLPRSGRWCSWVVLCDHR
ncbi:hypothetical protein FHW92_003676 [Novosphingobium sp. SG707]|nr:hypothetical protein [Novosphingobium sp. SG707]